MRDFHAEVQVHYVPNHGFGDGHAPLRQEHVTVLTQAERRFQKSILNVEPDQEVRKWRACCPQ